MFNINNKRTVSKEKELKQKTSFCKSSFSMYFRNGISENNWNHKVTSCRRDGFSQSECAQRAFSRVVFEMACLKFDKRFGFSLELTFISKNDRK